MSTRIRTIVAASIFLTAGLLHSCSASGGGEATTPGSTLVVGSIPLPAVAEDTPREYAGIHNAVAFHAGFISGSVPEGEEGFATLAAMGVKTIISVDGAEPEVDLAAGHGLRYIHLPIGYNGFDETRKLELTRATRDAISEGPVYLHCHHGKHRSAGAAASVAASLGWCTPEEGVARMKVSGTSSAYQGLYAAAERAVCVPPNVLDTVPADFPAISKPSSYVQGMVDVDHAYEHLKLIEQAGWTVPKDHPDLVPAAEAGRLADLYRNLQEAEYELNESEEFLAMMREANTTAQALEDLLAAGETDPVLLSAQFKHVSASCKTCHVKYRN